GQEDVRGFEWHCLHRLCHGELRILRGPGDAVAYRPDGTCLASASGRFVVISDATTGRHLLSFDEHYVPVTSVGYSPDGTRVASAGRDGVRVWDAATGHQLFALKDYTHSVRAVAYSPDG